MYAKSFVLFLSVIVLSEAQQHYGHNHEDHRVNVTVYYESLCPDSIKFVTKQLYPALQGNLTQFVDLNLIPYGKATEKFDVNQYEFTCRHGSKECYGNKIHACALHLVTKRDNLGVNIIATNFVNCLMDKVKRAGEETEWPVRDCATSANVNNLNDIENCANHPDGSNYLAAFGRATRALTPPLKSVPTIVFNNQYKEDDNVLSQTNFVKALCQYIQHDKPAECSANSAVASTFSLFTLLFLSILNFAR